MKEEEEEEQEQEEQKTIAPKDNANRGLLVDAIASA